MLLELYTEGGKNILGLFAAIFPNFQKLGNRNNATLR